MGKTEPAAALTSTTSTRLPAVPAEQINLRILREFYTRAQESVLLGVPAVIMLAYAHLDAQPFSRILTWTLLVLAFMAFRLLVAKRFLARDEADTRGSERWRLLACAGTVTFAASWVSCLTLLGGPTPDGLFYLRLLCLAGLAAFMLSTLGVAPRIYAGFLITFGVGVLGQLYFLYPGYLLAQPALALITLIYLVLLFRRSLSDHQHVSEWITARLAQALLVERLYAAMADEQAATHRLQQKTAEIEAINKQLHELATHDALTKAYNRAHMQKEIGQRVYACNRYRQEFSLLMLDIDHFKLVNDTYGHAMGDTVLCKVVEAAVSCLREADVFGRWGGEEFIAVLPSTNLEQAGCAANRLRTAIAAIPFDYEGLRFTVTASIGVCAARADAQESPESLVNRADAALYAAKHGGRNRVILAADTGAIADQST